MPVDDVLLTQTWIDGKGRTIARVGCPVQSRESVDPHEYLLQPGQHRVVVEMVNGRAAEIQFTVTDAPESDEVIELPSPVSG